MSKPEHDNNGLSGGLFNMSAGVFATLIALTALAWANAIEVIIRVFFFFKRRRGLYFWSVLTSAVGIVIHALGNVFKFFTPEMNEMAPVTFIVVGWMMMVTGQAFVLYSRLNLLIQNPKQVRRVLYMIIFNVFALHIPTTVLIYYSNSQDKNKKRFIEIFNVYEKIQITGFSIQECIISGLYIIAVRRLLRSKIATKKLEFRTVMNHLLYVSIFVILMDIGLLSSEYANQYMIEISLKPAIYAYKLRLEFTVLNRLVMILKSERNYARTTGLSATSTAIGSNSRATRTTTSSQDQLSKFSMHNSTLHDHNPEQTSYLVYAGKAGTFGSDSDIHENPHEDTIVARTEVKVFSQPAEDASWIELGPSSSSNVEGEEKGNRSKSSSISKRLSNSLAYLEKPADALRKDKDRAG